MANNITQSQTAPVFNYASLDSPVVYHQGHAISLGQLLRTVDYLAEKIPAHQHLLNLYEERYYFLLGFLLALKQQSISLFPSTITAHVLEQLKENYADILVLSDNDAIGPGFNHCNLKTFIKTSDLRNHTFSQPSSKSCVRHGPEADFSAIELHRQVAIIFTSGSTGQPKPYIKQWGDLVAVACYLAGVFLSDSSAADKHTSNKATISALLATVPAQHMYGLEASIMMALQNGLLIHSEKPFFPQDITHCLEDLRQFARQSNQSIATTLITTPLHLKACIKTAVSLPGVKQFISATAPLERELAQSCETKYSARMMEIFGCTEVGSMAWRRTIESEQWTVLNDISLQAIKHADKDEVQINTTRSIRSFLFNDFVDLLDKQHFLLKGRKEDLINQAGKRTSLSYLNYHLLSYDGLTDGCFYQDNSIVENRLVAFVVLDRPMSKEQPFSGQQEIDQQETERQKKHHVQAIRDYLKNRIEAVFLPKKIYFVAALPRNATGKLPLVQLKDLLLQQDTQ